MSIVSVSQRSSGIFKGSRPGSFLHWQPATPYFSQASTQPDNRHFILFCSWDLFLKTERVKASGLCLQVHQERWNWMKQSLPTLECCQGASMLAFRAKKIVGNASISFRGQLLHSGLGLWMEDITHHFHSDINQCHYQGGFCEHAHLLSKPFLWEARWGMKQLKRHHKAGRTHFSVMTQSL